MLSFKALTLCALNNMPWIIAFESCLYLFFFVLWLNCKQKVKVALFFVQHADIVGDEEHCYTYHVIYNESYRVPMLFLHGCLRGQFPMSQLC